MSQTLQNQILLAKSMNGIVSLSDGAGTTITGGQVITNDFSGNTIKVNSFSAATFDLTNSLTLEQYDNISTGVGLVSLWEKGKSYFTYLPQSLATPSNTSDLITLLFGDANYGRLTQTNTWTGTNTFTTQAANDKTTKAATTAFVSRMIYYDQTTHNLAINQEQFAVGAGGNNICLGFEAGKSITTGNNNTAIGTQALRSCTTGVQNFVLGATSLYSATSGSYNIAVGVFCLANSNGSYNIGFGAQCAGISQGDNNIYMGYFVAPAATTDGFNIGIGSYCYNALNSGKNCVAIGCFAGVNNTTGSQNTYIGHDAGTTSGNGTITYATAIGSGAKASTSNSIYLGRSTDMTYCSGGLTVPTGGITATATQTITFGSNAPIMVGTNITSIPDAALSSNVGLLTGTQTFTGAKTFSVAPVMSGASITNATIPDAALSTNVALLTGTQTFTGAKTFSNLTAASPLKITETSSIVQITESATGYNIIKYNNLYDCIGIGKATLNSLTTNAGWNIAIGSNALTTAQTSRGCIGIGLDALKLFNGLASSFSYTIAIGTSSMQNATTAPQCTAIGGSTAQNLTTGTGCTFLGNGTDFTSTTQYNYSTAIGNNAKITASNQIMMGTSAETVNIPGTLTVGGQVQNKAYGFVITGATSFASGLTNDSYSIAPASGTGFNITLPTITSSNVGQQVLFRRVSATFSTTVVSFIGDGTQFVYNTAITGGSTAQALMASGVYIVKLISLQVSGTTYAWFQV